MKKKILLSLLAIVIVYSITSCSSNPTAIIQTQVSLANKECPQNIGNGITVTAIEFDGRYVVYNYRGTDEMQFQQELVTPEMKDNLAQSFREKSYSDANLRKFIDALKSEHVGIIYHYFTPSGSVMDVIIESTDL